MKNLIVIFLLIFFSVSSYCNITQQWVRQFVPSTNYNQDAYDSYIDSAGNVYIAGRMGNGYSQTDIVTLKYNSDGEYQWAKTLNYDNVPYSNDNGKLISGYRFNGKQYVYTAAEVNYNGLNQFIWLIKYDESGNELYKRGYSSAGFGFSHSLNRISSDSIGNLIITGTNGDKVFLVKYDSALTNIFSVVFNNPVGYTTGSGFDFKVNSLGEIFIIGEIIETSSYTKKLLLLKYSGNGSLMFYKILNYILTPVSPAINPRLCMASSGNLYVAANVSTNYYLVKFNQSGDTLWKRVYNGVSNANDVCNACVLDANENFYVTGIVNGIYGDIGTVKYDSAGNQQWVKTLAGPNGWADEGKDIMADASGNIVVTGYIEFSVGQQFITLKYNPSGTLLWSTTYDMASADYESALIVKKDLNDNIVAVGNCGYVTNSDFATIKYNSSGGILWKRKFNGSQISTTAVNSVAVDKNENVYAIGRLRHGQFGDNIYLVKYNNDGVKKWEWNRGGVNVDIEDAGNAVCTDKNGYVYITGTMWLGTSQKRDIYSMKLDSNGNTLWNLFTSNYGGVNNDEGVEIATDNLGYVYVGYNSESSVSKTNFGVIKYNPSGTFIWNYTYNGAANDTDKMTDMRVDNSGIVYISGNTKTAANGYDIVTIKVDNSGLAGWVNTYNGTANSNDESRSIDFDKNGNVYVTGCVVNTVTGKDLFAIKYTSAGTQQWTYSNSNSDSLKESGVIIKYDSLSSLIRLAGDLKGGFGYGVSNYFLRIDTSGIPESLGLIIQPGQKNNYMIGGSLDAAGFIASNSMFETNNSGFDARVTHEIYLYLNYNGLSSGNDIPAFNESIAMNLNSFYSAVSSFDSTYGPLMTIIKYKAPVYRMALDLWIQGFVFPPGNVMYYDSIKVTLRNTAPPYNIIDSAKDYCSFEGKAYDLYFENITGINQYYVVVNHRNSIETWSKIPHTISPGVTLVDFKDKTNVYGDNLGLAPASIYNNYGMYSGDVNQDDIIDVGDVIEIYNDMVNFNSGYINTDITGDDFVDVSDLLLAYNNANGIVSTIMP